MTAHTTARVPYARPRGAPSIMAGTYSGVELSRTSLRPGAYDAFALPSVHRGKRQKPKSPSAPGRSDLPCPPDMPQEQA
jgi:hypothetical protein